MEEDRLHDFRDDFSEPYLDDVIVYSKSFKELVDKFLDGCLQISAISTKSDMSHSSQQNENIKKIQVSFKTPVMWEEKHRQALNVLASHPVLATNGLFTAFYFTY